MLNRGIKMNTITNYSLQKAPNFGNTKRRFAEKAVQNIDKALQIANKNPGTHNIYFSNEPGLGQVINILRHSGDNTIRNAVYNPKTGELIKMERSSFSKNKKTRTMYQKMFDNILEYDTKGTYTCSKANFESLKVLIFWCRYFLKHK